MASDFPVCFSMFFVLGGFFWFLELTWSHKGKKRSGRFIQHFVIKSILTAGNVSEDLFSVSKIHLCAFLSCDTQVRGPYSVMETDGQINQEQE